MKTLNKLNNFTKIFANNFSEKITKKSKYFQVGIFILLTLSFSLAGCNIINKTASMLNNFQNLQFKLGRADNFVVNSVNISNIKSVSDLSVSDGLRLTQAVANKSLPVNFTLNILVNNPNSKSSNSGSSSNFDAVISGIDWTLFIDEKETINGRVTTPITVPSGNQTTVIPVSIGLDLVKFFGDKSYLDIMNLALAIGGANGSSSKLKLKMRPTVSIAGFPISYPNYFTVIDKEFNSGKP